MNIDNFVLFVSLLYINHIEVEAVCAPYSEPSECANPFQMEKCTDLYYNGDPPRVCTLDCPQGCVCKSGYILDDINDAGCIPVGTCPKICCAANRHFVTCGPPCPPSCIHPNGLPCRAQCRDGCFCNKGLVEDGFGNCIPLEQCPLNCGENEIQDNCANPCQPTCLNPNPDACFNKMCSKKCVCRPPYLRDLPSGKCLDKTQCEKQCVGKNQAYDSCGTACPRTCENYKDTNNICQAQCIPGCRCKDGYVLDKNKNCILPEFCDCKIT